MTTTLPTADAVRPLRRDAEQNRQRIMTAARLVFAQRGFDTTLDEVAHQAQLGVGTVYRRFPNKAALFDALFEESVEDLTGLAEQAARSPDAWAGLVGFMTAVAELQVADRGLRDLMLSAGAGPDRAAQLRSKIKPVTDLLVWRAQAEGTLRADFHGGDIPVLQLMITAAFEFTRAGETESWRRYLELLLDGLRARRDQPSPLTQPVLDDDALERAMGVWPANRRGRSD
jgi:AcrR family transcriptional regulator